MRRQFQVSSNFFLASMESPLKSFGVGMGPSWKHHLRWLSLKPGRKSERYGVCELQDVLFFFGERRWTPMALSLKPV